MPTLLKDDTGVPIPQYMNENGTGFESMQGKDGAINATVAGLLEAIDALKTVVDTISTIAADTKTAVEAIQATTVSIKEACETIATNTTPEVAPTE